eukprot:COSAG02_NODE_16357_length_1090_cov_1.249243_2_plen_88_part_01
MVGDAAEAPTAGTGVAGRRGCVRGGGGVWMSRGVRWRCDRYGLSVSACLVCRSVSLCLVVVSISPSLRLSVSPSLPSLALGLSLSLAL